MAKSKTKNRTHNSIHTTLVSIYPISNKINSLNKNNKTELNLAEAIHCMTNCRPVNTTSNPKRENKYTQNHRKLKVKARRTKFYLHRKYFWFNIFVCR